MGTDNLYHRRKPTAITDLKREQRNRKKYERILILCEDGKSAPYYLDSFCNNFHLKNITIKGMGVSPLKIVEAAIAELKSYDRVYCHFDQDTHADYKQALDRVVANQKNYKKIYAITSVPCFEYWILLHYRDSSKPYKAAGSKSAGDRLESEVKIYIPDYHKGHKSIFEITKPYLDLAIDRANRIDAQQKTAGTDNPSTKMHELIEYLIRSKK